MNNNMLCLKVFYNNRFLNTTRILLVLTNHLATVIFLNTDVFKKPQNYTKMMGSVTTNNNSEILLRPLWFLFLKDSPKTVPYLPWTHQHSRNQVLENHYVFSLTHYMWKRKLLNVKSELLNKNAMKLNKELRHGNWNQNEKEIQ